MNLDFLENLNNAIEKTLSQNRNQNSQNIRNTDISQDELELANKLNAIIEYTIDRFEENFAVCENRKTGEMQNIERENLPEDIKEGDIIKEINGKYFKDEQLTNEVSERIKNKMNNLWN